jgi:hypothetical protein
MQQSLYTYPEAVHFAAARVLSDDGITVNKRIEGLQDLLYSLDSSIPESWHTRTRTLLSRRECNMDRVLEAVSKDLTSDVAPSRYDVLGAILQLVLTVKNYGVRVCN